MANIIEDAGALGIGTGNVQEFYEMAAPSLNREEILADDFNGAKIYMVNMEGSLVPIHPEPNNDQRIAKILRVYEVIVTNGNVNPDNGLYLQTILPLKGWVKRQLIDDRTLVEVRPETAEALADMNVDESSGGCCRWLESSQVVQRLSISVRKHPIYMLAGLIALHFLAECVVFADLVTDVLVAMTLARNKKDWLLMLTIVFILAPYYIAWAAAFGYLQKKAMDSTADAARDNQQQMRAKTDLNHVRSEDPHDPPKKQDPEDPDADEEDEEDSEEQQRLAPARSIQVFVLLFSIAPIGVCFLVLLDVYLIIEDLFIKPFYLCCTKRMLREESHAEAGYKKLRRVSEVVAETICQSVLQLGMYAHYAGTGQINTTIVLVSLLTSILVLAIWGTVLKYEARGFGLRFYEYVTVVLQGSFNFVPYLPAIERGKKQTVNWTNYCFDSHSVGLVSKALISPECDLRAIKLSAYSLRKLTRHESRFLGQMLADSPKQAVEVVFSRSRQEIQLLFEKFDEDNSRTFDFWEFLKLCAALRQTDDGVVSATQAAETFRDICDLRTRQVYLTDLLLAIGKREDRVPVVDYDSPLMYALKVKDTDPNLLTFMLAGKICDEQTWEFYTTTLVTKSRHKDALLMCEDRGVPVVVEVMSATSLGSHDRDGLSDPYVSVSVAGQVHRTETRFKSLNPVWNQTLLFTVPREQVPEALGKGESPRKHRYSSGAHTTRRTTHRKRMSQVKPHIGHHIDLNKLEIGFKVYDYDDEEDDDFMGSYKHFLKWNEASFATHQPGNDNPNVLECVLRNRGDEAGLLKFRIYVATLRYYVRWGQSVFEDEFMDEN